MTVTTTSPLTIEETILQVIALTMQIRRKDAEKIRARRPTTGSPGDLIMSLGEAFTSEDMDEMMNGPRDPRFDLLEALSDADARKVEVLVYAGRLRELSPSQAARNVRRETKDRTVDHLVSTMGNVLDEFLIVGWAKVTKERGSAELRGWDPDADAADEASEGQDDDEDDDE